MEALSNEIKKLGLKSESSILPQIAIGTPEQLKLVPDVCQKLEKVLYEGANGTVVKGLNKSGTEHIVVKTIKRLPDDSTEHYTSAVIKEYQLIKLLKNKNIMEILDICKNQDTELLSFITPFYPQGDLLDFLSHLRRKKVSLNSNLKDYIFKQIVKGVSYLHSINVIHRDIKPENLLISSEGLIKISDFGYYLNLDDIDEKFWTPDNKRLLCGTNSFKAPELFEYASLLSQEDGIDKIKRAIDFKSLDYWSLGITYIQIYLMKTPWKCATSDDPSFHYFKNNYPASDNLVHQLNKDIEDMSSSKINPSSRIFKELHYGARYYILKLLNPVNSKRLDLEGLLLSDWLLQAYADPKELISFNT